jgi:TonB family protein
MTAALLYRPAQRWQIWVAFACAIMLHFAAIAVARNAAEIPSLIQSIDDGVNVVIDPTQDQTPVSPEEITPTQPSDFVKSDEAFPEESSSPAPIRRPDQKPQSRLVRPASVAGMSGTSFSSVKVLAVYAPRPEYPYQARRERTTGSGLVILMIDSSTGSVTDARMAQSTGRTSLDNSAVSTLRRWRFKSETVTKVQVPITYTLSGASY